MSVASFSLCLAVCLARGILAGAKPLPGILFKRHYLQLPPGLVLPRPGSLEMPQHFSLAFKLLFFICACCPHFVGGGGALLLNLFISLVALGLGLGRWVFYFLSGATSLLLLMHATHTHTLGQINAYKQTHRNAFMCVWHRNSKLSCRCLFRTHPHARKSKFPFSSGLFF